ncbi:MAG: MerR family transcriptional regulator [Coriobacteriales bacterium]|nr:MerR family transcriptional regulator [Coriobacteriales bacterium]
MSKYTTGEIAKLCGVTVRTVQYYDTRGILVPSELSEGGRRLYSEDDLRRLQIICFLRDLGLSIDSIFQIFAENDPASVISILLEQQKLDLKEEITERKEQLNKLEELQQGLKMMNPVSVASIGDIAYIMSSREKPNLT